LNFIDGFSTDHLISNFMKIRPLGAKLFRAERRRGKHDEGNNCFSLFSKRA